ncbi:MAG: N-acetylglucosamine kinase [Sphingobacteriales bacterium]|nr:MAG: N-acetylglucosamine kinase [Sphingobacteriales bacterium]
MILFADSGSTKTNWLLYNTKTKEKLHFDTLGINPIIHHHQEIIDIISKNEVLVSFGMQIKTIHFFGAGCSSIERNLLAKNAMHNIFPKADIFIDEDMIGAGISICGNQKGIACILGTGSNSIYFDGQKWHESNGGIGFILGDEGSGSYFGKLILRDFLYQKLPHEIEHELKEKYHAEKNEIFHKTYKAISPNRYLASFAPILSTFRATEYVQLLLQEGFTSFIDYHVCCFPNYQEVPVGFVGSIASNFQSELAQVAWNFDIQLGKFVSQPIEEVANHFISILEK